MADVGFYSPGASWLHRTHGAAKIVVFAAAVPLATLLLTTSRWHVPVALGLVAVVASARLQGAKLWYFAPAVPLVAMTGLSWLVFANSPDGPAVWDVRLGPLDYVLYEGTAHSAAVAVLRGAIFVLAYVALLATTTSRDLLAGLDRLRIPDGASRAVAMTLRFWTVVIDDAGRVAEAQQARGMDLDSGPRWRGLVRRVATATVPTLFLMLKRFQTLSFALTLRAMGARGGATRLYSPPLGRRDGVLCGLTAVLLGLLLALDRVVAHT